jgi:predicted ATPase/DNA-binding SARP family transcriptional activator
MLRIHLFGHLKVFHGDQPVRFSALPKTLPLWVYLLLHRSAALAREPLAFTLWPDVDESEARGNLRRHLHDLKRALPPAPQEAPWLLIDATSVQWNPDAPYWLDVQEFEQAVALPQRWTEAAALYTGDLLPAIYDDWAMFERERLRNRFFDVLSQLMQQHHARRDLFAAIACAQQMLAYDPMREDVVRELMSLRFEAGDRPGALQEYQRFEQRLREEMDVAPMVETNALYDSIARHIAAPANPQPARQTVLPAFHAAPEPTAPVSTAPVPTAPVVEPVAAGHPQVHTNLPAQLTSFVGREQELAALRTVLLSPQTHVRLLTLTGPGGSGKSRLAIEVAGRLRSDHPDRFPGGIFFVPLVTVADPKLVLSAIADTLDVRESSGQSLLDILKEYMRPRQMLLLLDNFEHVADAAPLLVDLLRAAPGLIILVTSRVVLHIYGEHEFPVAPLPLPSAETPPRANEVVHSAAVKLFVTRSRAVRPNFVLNDENAAAVAEICTRLDGLPLAIELAAARSKLLAPAALLERLRSGLAILTDRNRNLAERHQTLESTLVWSYQLLGERERTLFRHMSVFSGSFSLEAAESVCGNTDVLDGLEALVDNSLLQQVEVDTIMLGDSALPGEELRFRMLSTIRQYAAGQLDASSDAASIRRRHADTLLRLAEQAEVGLRGADQAMWLQRLEIELFNLRAALRWCLDGNADEILLGMRLAAALGIFWYLYGYLSEAQRWLSEALDKGRHAPDALRARALYALGSITHAQGDLKQAPPLFEESLRQFQNANDQHGIADALYALGRLANRQQQYDLAKQLLHESLRLSDALGDDYRTAYSLNILAGIATNAGENEQARVLYEQALTRARKVQNKSGIAFILTAFGELERLLGNDVLAERYYNEAMQLARETAQKPRVVMLLHNLAQVALSRGETRRAAALFRECLTLGMELPDKENFGMCLVGLGGVACHEGQPERAVRLFGAGEMVLESIGARLAPADQVPYDRFSALARSKLPAERVEALFQAGRLLGIAEAERLALGG